MALIWQKTIDGCRYEVRKAGKTTRLYTNGVCHSDFNPGRLLGGSIWDLLILPAFFYEPGAVKRVLMLGVGGGASILQLHHLLEPDSITGVELDPVHLDIARRFFNINTTSVVLHESEARSWLEHYEGEPFDMIVDDLFVNEGSEPVRALKANDAWFELILKHLSAQGQVVVNFASELEFKESGYFSNVTVNRRLKSAFRLSSPLLDNVVGAFLAIDTNSAHLRRNLVAHPLIAGALQSRQLRYRIRQVQEVHQFN